MKRPPILATFVEEDEKYFKHLDFLYELRKGVIRFEDIHDGVQAIKEWKHDNEVKKIKERILVDGIYLKE